MYLVFVCVCREINDRGRTPSESESQYQDKIRTPMGFVPLCIDGSPPTHPITKTEDPL